jgi:ABC-type Fe3+/spermidine/putrescine transport system ATPase subunit
LLDEPLSNLDARLRDEMREEIRRLHAATQLTTIYVTHDQKEALALAGRLAVMDRGKVVQVGTPAEVYARPSSRFVAGFLGDSNFLPGVVRDGGAVETAVGMLAASACNFTVGTKVVCSIRPQAFALDSPAGFNQIPATVRDVLFLGNMLQVRLNAAGGTELMVLGLPREVHGMAPDTKVVLSVDPDQVVLLPAL